MFDSSLELKFYAIGISGKKSVERILRNYHVDLDTGCVASRIQGVESIRLDGENSRHV